MGSYHVQEQQLSELDVLQAEASGQRNLTVLDAIGRVRRSIEARVPVPRGAAEVVQQFIGSRTAQNRYGQ